VACVDADVDQRERELAGVEAALVAAGAALFVDIAMRFRGIYGGTPSPLHVVAYVVSGVGFPGAGAIMREEGNIRGLNTADTLWGSAAVGVAAGTGMLLEAVLGTLFVLYAALKEAWASHVAMQLGNVTPRTAAFVGEHLGKIVSPSAYLGFMESLATQADRIKQDQLTIQFSPTHVYYVEERDLVVVSGEYAIRGLRDSEKRSVRTYEIGIDVANYQVSVTSLSAYEGPWAPGREEQQRLKEQRERAEKRRVAMEEKRT
jgi:hypothetical protein